MKAQFVELRPGEKRPLNRNVYYDSVQDLNDAAIALDNAPGVIFIDFDGLDENGGSDVEDRIAFGIVNMYPTSLMVKTPKGYHFYYKTRRKLKCWTKKYTAIGVKTDAKIGNQLGVIKQNGVMRDTFCFEIIDNQLVQEYGSFDFDKLPELPDILLPVNCKKYENLGGLEEGHRHTALLSHLSRVRYEYEDADISSIAHFINDFVFKHPLPYAEVSSIVDSVYSLSLYKNKKEDKEPELDMKQVAQILVDTYDIHISGQSIYYYLDGKYRCNENEFMRLAYAVYPFSRGQYDELKFQLRILGKIEDTGNEIISINNGYIVNGEYVDNIKEFTSTILDITYDKNAYNKDLDNFLQFISNNNDSSEKNELRLLIEEMIGHCLMLKRFPQKIFFLLGIGANGKSTFMNMLYSFLGDLAVSIPVNRLDKDDYVARLNNKLANISDDIDYDYLKNSQNVKKLASGDVISARELYGKAFDFKNKATLIFSLNEMVDFKDHSYGMERRISIIPFNNKVVEKDPFILEKITCDEAKSYLLNLALDGIRRIKSNNKMTEPEEIKELVNQYLTETDSFYSFLQDTDDNQIIGYPFRTVYELYKNYCLINNFKPINKNKFSRKMRNKGYDTKVKNIANRSERVMCKIN